MPPILRVGRSVLKRLSTAVRFALVAFVTTAACALRAGDALAAAEVRRLSLVFSANPTSIDAGGFNDVLDLYNERVIEPTGRQGLDRIGSGWWFDAELRYFVRQNVAVSVGVGQIKSQSKREYLPLIQQDILIRAEVLAVPVHIGGDYYLQPYNQGDFQARAYLGGGFLSLVKNKALLQQTEINTDPTTTLGGTFTRAAVRDAPGYYVQGGVHMFFAARYSVMVGTFYRSAKIRNMLDRTTGQPALVDGEPFDFDMGGIGARMSLAIGF